MKTRIRNLFAALALLALPTLNPHLSTCFAQGTAFTYQGQLQNNDSPASGTYNLAFSLFNTNATGVSTAGPVTTNGVIVSNGLFTVLIDFGHGVFTGTNYWLEIGVETNGASPFTTLAPRQQLTPVPYAIFAESASNLLGSVPATQLTGTLPGGSLSGTYGNAVTLNNAGDIFSGTFNGSFSGIFSGSGANLNVSTAQLTGGANYNVFIGPAGNSTTTGGDDTASGFQALHANTTGSSDTASGYFALHANTTGSLNTANGLEALQANTIGSLNTANGYQALQANTSGSLNTADGGSALNYTTFGSYNTADGFGALYENSSGSNNIALGYEAGFSISTGSSNIDIGNVGVAGDANIIRIGSGQSQTFIAGVINGNGGGLTNLNLNAAQLTSIGNNNFFVGPSGNLTTSGSGNTAIGVDSLLGNTSGSDNTANGYYALANNQGGSGNTADGAVALLDNTSGSNNIALGFAAGDQISTGSFNIDIGNQGLSTDTNIIRIGDPNFQTTTYIAGVINGNGGGLTNLNVAALNGLSATNFWQTTGNSGTTPGVNFVGTTDGQPLELRADGLRALRLEPVVTGYQNFVNVIGGSSVNFVAGGVGGATIGGGGTKGGNVIPASSNSVTAIFGTVGGGTANTASGGYATVGGGTLNTAAGGGSYVGGGGYDGTAFAGNSAFGDASVIGGGLGNTNNGYSSFVGGGSGNFIEGGLPPGGDYYAVIAGGQQNLIEPNTQFATISGGGFNTVDPFGLGPSVQFATISGGESNIVAGSYATIPGGATNLATGAFSFAAGDEAQATNDGAFVWADAEGAPFASTTANQFNVRANGGVVFVTGGAGMTIDGQSVFSASQLNSIGNSNSIFGFNFFAGPAGNSTMRGGYNTGIGYYALYSNTTGDNNTANGAWALEANTNGLDNTAYGTFALEACTSGVANTAIGEQALDNLVVGSGNIALGYQAGDNFYGNESGNIDIGNAGIAGDNNIIRIGSGQTSTYIAGVITNSGTLTLQAGTDMDLAAANNLNTTLGADMRLTAHNLTATLAADMNLTASGKVNVTADTTMDLESGTTMTVKSGAASPMQIVSGAALSLTGTQLALTGGNVGIGTTTPGYLLVVGSSGSPAYCDGTTWQNGSDRNSKENFAAIKPADVLARVAALPITEWKYKVEPDGTEHLGPMAQDFHAAFGLNGPDDKHIATVDEEGVALAAIQGLNQKLNEKDAEIEALQQSVAELKQLVQTLAEKK